MVSANRYRRLLSCFLSAVLSTVLLGFPCVELAVAEPVSAEAHSVIRVATYNVSFYRDRSGQFLQELLDGNAQQAQDIAEVLQRVRPDIVLLNEVDYDSEAAVVDAFRSGYLEVSQSNLEPLLLPHHYTAQVNTGVPSGHDLDSNGTTKTANDAFGYGKYPGQYGMVVLSRFPIDAAASRTFQKLRWQTMPGALLPTDPTTGNGYYSDAVLRDFRLSSKSFWDVVVRLPSAKPLHLLCSHPTPPVFDGPEDRNGKRNHDEVRLIADYLTNKADYLIDDKGQSGGLNKNASFVILGDLNADPLHGSGIKGTMQQLLNHPRVNGTVAPTSNGGPAASKRAADLNRDRAENAAQHTADFGKEGHGNLRIDYALPSKNFEVAGTGVHWPAPGEPGSQAIQATDHRLVWIDLRVD